MFTYTKFSDEELIAKYLNGDDQAFDALIPRYKSLVYTIPMRFGMSEDEANDVFQAVWLKLLENLTTLRQRDRLNAWLVTTARRECLSRRRGAKYEREETTDPHQFPEDRWILDLTPEQIVIRYEKHQAVRQAIKQLGGRCERLLRYLFYSDSKHDYAKIASDLGMSEGSVGPTRARCLKKLKKILTKPEKSTKKVSNTGSIPL